MAATTYMGAAVVGNDGAAPSFFDRTQYTSRVLNQAALGDYHGFPQSADAFSREGTVSPIVGLDGVTRWQLRYRDLPWRERGGRIDPQRRWLYQSPIVRSEQISDASIEDS